MSWEAVQWANKQRLRLPQEQLVLLMLANSADPEGVAFTWWKRKEHWWTYLVDRTRLSRATIFRHITTIEKLGLGERQKLVLADGPVRFIMALNLEKFVDIEAEEADDPQDLESQSHGETGTECNQSHGETGEIQHPQSHGETVPVSLVRLQEKPILESLKTLPNPSHDAETPQKGLSKEEPAISAPRNPQGLVLFKQTFGGPPSAYPELVTEEWNKLSPDDEPQIMRGARGAAEMRLKKFKGIVGPLKFLRNRVLWSDYGIHAPREPAQPPPSVPVDSREGRALKVIYAIARRHPSLTADERAYVLRHPLTVQALTLAEAPDRREWPLLNDPKQAGAWADLMRPIINCGPSFSDEVVGQKFGPDASGQRVFLGNELRSGFRAPWPWPPRKDGSLCTGPPESETG